MKFQLSGGSRTKDVLEIVHMDICGPMRSVSHSGTGYLIVFVNDKSRWCTVEFLKEKSEALNSFKKFKAQVERETDNQIQFLQSDNAEEFVSRDFENFLVEHGIQRCLTAPYTLQQNGVAERMNRTLVEMARCLLRQGKMPSVFWAEAVNTACYIRNRCVSKSLDGKTPHQVWKNKIPSLTYFQTFGCTAFLLDKTQKGKFSSRGIECVFVGYSSVSKSYRLCCPERKTILISRDFKFMDSYFFDEVLEDFYAEKREEKGERRNKQENRRVDFDLSRERNETDDTTTVEVTTNVEDEELANDVESRRRIARGNIPSAPIRRRPGRPKIIRTGSVGRPKKLYNLYNEESQRDDGEEGQEDDDEEHKEGDEDDGMIARQGAPQIVPDEVFDDALDELQADVCKEEFVNFSVASEPETWNEAEATDEVEDWRAALEDEFISLICDETWDIVGRPQDRKTIRNCLVFRTKEDANRKTKKVRLVAKGCSQNPGVDFTETYSPVVKTTSIRLLAALAAEKGLVIHQMDVVTAYLNGFLEKKVYMETPAQLKEVLGKIVTGKRVGLQSRIIKDQKIIYTARKWLKDLEEQENPVCLLKRALYGLKQSGVQWYKFAVPCNFYTS